MKKDSHYTVRPSYFGDKWIAESPRGISTQHNSKEKAVTHALERSHKIIYSLPLQSVSISREAITVFPPNDYEKLTLYEWKCPQCGTRAHGDSKRDTVFEIRHDPLCITCRVKNGEFTFDGSTYKRVKP